MFKKGQLVTVISNWSQADINWKGERTATRFSVQQLVVHSCGKKQMILANEAGEVFKGKNYLPQTEQYGFEQVLPRISTEEALVIANEQASKWNAKEAEQVEARVAHYTAQGNSKYAADYQPKLDYLRSNPVLPAATYEDLVAAL